jgi:hypothetical protein
MKGAVLLPFCGLSFLEKVLSIPMDYRRDQSLYGGLLERVKPGLSHMVSTNTRDDILLGPYLIDAVKELTWHGKISHRLRKQFPGLAEKIQEIRRDHLKGARPDWADDLIQRPPRTFMDFLSPSLRRAIEQGDRTRLKPYHFFAEKIMILEGFFDEGR